MDSSLGANAPAPKKYVPAVGPGLKKLLAVVFVLFALLSANSVYLIAITFLEWMHNQTYQDYFYQYMFLGHLGLGLIFVVPTILFGVFHMVASWNRRNKRAIRIGYALFVAAIVLLVSGGALMRIGSFDLKNPTARTVTYWAHVVTPLLVVWLYWLHRLAGPRIKWRIGLAYAGVVAVCVAAMVAIGLQNPRKWNVVGPKEGEQYFHPSLARTSDGNFIPSDTLMMDEYCKKCHTDVFNGWYHSVHRTSSFNNPAYLASVRETRDVVLKRDNTVQASRWCAGCHDPVPFFSGAFDNPKFDLVNDKTAHAGITCTVCHAITNVNSPVGNADYTIEEPLHYPFAKSDNTVLQYINNQLVKAKPSFHKKTFLKPFHKTAEFCSTCHKVGLPYELNHYKEFLRGQNHYDTYLLSGVSGHGARSFYYPPKAKTNCAACHMPLQPSDDFGAKFFDGADKLSVHNHLFPAANTGIAFLRNEPEIVKAHQDFLKGCVRVDIFGVREGGNVDDPLTAPLRPKLPKLKPGKKYLVEAVLRTLKLGHPFTQGTVDSNEVWLETTVTSGGKVIGKNGGIDATGEVDPWAHFINVYMLDKDGNRISRRNPQDIFVPLYNHQIPPGAGNVVHYELRTPEKLTAPVTVEVKLQYRKFDKKYMDFVTSAAKEGDLPIRGYTPGKPYYNELPVTTIAMDTVTFPVEGVDVPVPEQKSAIENLWERWNDYGIGLFLEGQLAGGKGELRQATEAFLEVEKLKRFDGPLNLARVYNQEGRLDEAVGALRRAAEHKDPPPPEWTISWLSGLINRQQGHLDEAIQNFKAVVDADTAARRERGFDFSLDYEVINELGVTLFDRAKQERGDARTAERDRFLKEAIKQFKRTLAIDPENVTAHYNLALLYAQLGEESKAEESRRLHKRYKPDDNARDRALALARQKDPAANHAAERLVIYSLHRTEGAKTADIVNPGKGAIHEK